MGEKSLQENHNREVNHLYGLIDTLREQIVILSSKRIHPSCSPTPATKKFKPAKCYKFLGEAKCISLKPGIRVFGDNISKFVLQSELLRASGKSSFRFIGLKVATVDFQQLKKEYDINPKAKKAFILDPCLIRFVESFSADLAVNLTTLYELV